jgi:hypothetical protein
VPLHLIPEVSSEHPCANCGAHGAVIRFYVELADLRGETAYVCRNCVGHMVQQAELEGPPQEWGARPPSRQMRKTSQRQEREMAQLIGGRRQKGSGALVGDKGDVRLQGVLRGEMKLTSKRSFSLTREVLDKIRSECVGRERPFVGLRFINPDTHATEDEWVVIPLEDWEHAPSHNQ